MQVRDVQTFVVGNPPPHFGGRYFVFVKLTTDGNVSGIGEVYGAPFHPDLVAKLIEDVAARHVVGADPFRIETIWRRVYSDNYSQRPDTTLVPILSGLEMALWDIIGKETGRPAHALLGGRVHEGLRSYTYLYPKPDDTRDVYVDPDLAGERAAEYVAQGFSAIKFDPVRPYTAFDPRQLSMEQLDLAERYVKTLREAVGTKADLLVGTHGQMTPASALRLARRLEPYDPLWLEEPTPPENVEAMARVAAGTTIPVATGERLSTKYEFAAVLRAGAASILQMALGRVGGLLEAKKIAGMAEAHYAQIAPHLYCGPIEGAANVQISACSPNFLILESIQTWGGFHAEILKTPMRWQDGFVIPPDAPGLGIELDEAVAARHPYTGDELHLTVHPDPV